MMVFPIWILTNISNFHWKRIWRRTATTKIQCVCFQSQCIMNVSMHHPQSSSSTTILNHHPQPLSSTVILNHHCQPSSSTTILNHHPQPPSSTTILNHHSNSSYLDFNSTFLANFSSHVVHSYIGLNAKKVDLTNRSQISWSFTSAIKLITWD